MNYTDQLCQKLFEDFKESNSNIKTVEDVKAEIIKALNGRDIEQFATFFFEGAPEPEPYILQSGEGVILWPMPADPEDFAELSNKLTADLYGEHYKYTWPDDFDPYDPAPVVVSCPYHGKFYMQPERHITEGDLCPACEFHWFRKRHALMTEEQRLQMVIKQRRDPQEWAFTLGCLYVLKSNAGLLKVGISSKLSERLATLRKANPELDLTVLKTFTIGDKSFSSARRLEKALHQALKAQACHAKLAHVAEGSTEFFKYDEGELFRMIKALGGVEQAA